jgi:hypothetical protein
VSDADKEDEGADAKQDAKEGALDGATDEAEAPPEANDALPPRVETVLARAREAVRADAKRREGRWLAVVPLSIAILMFLLTMPRATVPEDVPLPAVDQRALDAVTRADDARATNARTSRLSPDILAVGTTLRALNAALSADDPDKANDAREAVDGAVRSVPKEGVIEGLLALRASQLEQFLAEVARFEDTGTESKELVELAGPFVQRMRDAGWIDGKLVILDEPERRVSFKVAWNTLAGTDSAPPMQLTLDEQRVLYRLYLRHPHPPELQRMGLVAQRRDALTPADCESWARSVKRATETWRADKIRRLGALDPTYPTHYALGVAMYRAGDYEGSIDAFRAWIDAHPDGKWSMRARNHLKAALAAYGSI